MCDKDKSLVDSETLSHTKPLTGSDPRSQPSCRSQSSASREWTPPETVGTTTSYEIRAQLAMGGMGIVYRAWDQLVHRDVAVKLLRGKYSHKPAMIHRFVNESRVMGRLQHPGIPPVYDSGVCADGRPYYAMKLVKGVTLSELNQHDGRGRVGLLGVFAQVCQTLDYAHSQGVAHLDIKPSNIMVGAFGEVYVMDWGLARYQADPNSEKTQAAVPESTAAQAEPGTTDEGFRIRGTPAYMSPEQATGERVDARADIFGLGAILCELLTGLPPYQGTTARNTLQRAATAETEIALQRLDSTATDPRLIRLAKRCLATDPNDRPRSARDLAQELQVYQEALLSRADDDMQRFFELSLDLFCIAGLDGYFRRINANFTRVLGYREEDLLHRPFVDFVHPDDRKATYDAMDMLARGESVVRFRNRYQAVDGKYVVFEWTAKPSLGNHLVYAAARDVTEHYDTQIDRPISSG